MRADRETPFAALVVDDSMLIRHTVSRFLEDRGFLVESATNGQEALERLKRHIPDVIITDMDMPKMSGSALIQALKSDAKTAEIPVIALAGKSSGAKYEQHGANFAIFKDIEIEDQLEKALQAVLGSRSVAKCTGL